jgi:hypothetical protein
LSLTPSAAAAASSDCAPTIVLTAAIVRASGARPTASYALRLTPNHGHARENAAGPSSIRSSVRRPWRRGEAPAHRGGSKPLE